MWKISNHEVLLQVKIQKSHIQSLKLWELYDLAILWHLWWTYWASTTQHQRITNHDWCRQWTTEQRQLYDGHGKLRLWSNISVPEELECWQWTLVSPYHTLLLFPSALHYYHSQVLSNQNSQHLPVCQFPGKIDGKACLMQNSISLFNAWNSQFLEYNFYRLFQTLHKNQ